MMPRGIVTRSHGSAMKGRVVNTIQITVAPGELIDKMTILEIKLARFTDRSKIENVQCELELLQQAHAQQMASTPTLAELTRQLKETNEKLWDVEDAIRKCEANQDFGTHFIELARSVYKTNDLRAHLKRRINELLGSTIVEEKEYVEYPAPPAHS